MGSQPSYYVMDQPPHVREKVFPCFFKYATTELDGWSPPTGRPNSQNPHPNAGLESSQMEICSDGKEYVDLPNDHEESSLNAGEF